MTPGECEYDRHTFLMGKSHKTLCALGVREIWTTCRDWGRCTFEGRKVPTVTEDDLEECETEPEIDEQERTNANVCEQERMFANKSEPEQMTLF